MLVLLRKQVSECCKQIDIIGTWQRRKELTFLGVEEAEKADWNTVINGRMGLKNVSASSIKVCYRLEVLNNTSGL